MTKRMFVLSLLLVSLTAFVPRLGATCTSPEGCDPSDARMTNGQN